MNDLISRQAAIDVIKRLMGDSELSRTVQTGLYILPSAQAGSTDNAEFWRKRANDYENMVINLTEKISKDARLESMEMNAEGLVFKMKEPSVQPEEKTGEWIVTSEFEDCRYAKCNQCKVTQVFYYNKPLTNFCPNCGANMRGYTE